MPQAAVVMLRVMGALAGLRSRGDRRRAAALGERVFPGRLRVLGSRTLFPQTTGSEVTRVMGVNRLLPGRVDRTEGHVLFRDEPEEGRTRFGRHALRVVTDLDGELVGEPTVLRDVRDGDGTLRLPPLQQPPTP